MNKKYCEKEEKKTSTEMTDWTELKARMTKKIYREEI